MVTSIMATSPKDPTTLPAIPEFPSLVSVTEKMEDHKLYVLSSEQKDIRKTMINSFIFEKKTTSLNININIYIFVSKRTISE